MSGIVDFGIGYPGGQVSVAGMHASSGVPTADILKITHAERFPALDEHELSWQMALRAAREVLYRNTVEPSDIRYVVYAGSGEWDIPFWSPAAKVAHGLGIEWAHCFEVSNFCNGGMTALKIAGDKLELRGTGHALVLVADQLSRMVDYSDPQSKALFNFGDAAAAVLVAPGSRGPFLLLHSAMRTDPGWSDYYAGEYEEGRVRIRRGAHRKGLAEAYVRNFTDLIEETLDGLGRKLSEVAYLLINQGDRDMHERLLRELDFPAEKSVFNYSRLGHMGGADTLIALQQLRVQGLLRPGDLLLLATSAMGFTWGITALEFQG
ncbi:3-oxoacyl-ACP synthase III family protein [Streptacidiphilus fuscans]|uniref:3-oxoacyl-ACP synthase n=1 Tax=Streptacidiphilus fuscans TaxID=2789292 RepID=A0A931FIU8_9ACTN|nr:3-oxoacyl-[acyl-carrier-protein] synthase III C-terminal domain-containing protein [Streptacidiphilus fuscans]MBF9073296.1 3-oxoacyl-ACP synthase [Streptacidiphilus fuscans]